MKKYENLKQLHENEYARLAIDLHNINEQRKKTLKRMKELEDENARLKKMYAEEKLKSEIAREAIAKKW